jgi:hypothetical protein
MVTQAMNRRFSTDYSGKSSDCMYTHSGPPRTTGFGEFDRLVNSGALSSWQQFALRPQNPLIRRACPIKTQVHGWKSSRRRAISAHGRD